MYFLKKNYLILSHLLITSFVLFAYLVISNFSIYGLNNSKLLLLMDKIYYQENINIYFGGLISKLSILGLNLMPYLFSSIIITFLCFSIPYFKALKNEKQSLILQWYLYFFTFLSSIMQSYFLLSDLIGKAKDNDLEKVIDISENSFIFYNTIILTSGTFFILFLVYLINTFGTKQGIPVILLINIIYYKLNNLYLFYIQENNLLHLAFVIVLYSMLLMILYSFQNSYFITYLNIPKTTYNKLNNNKTLFSSLYLLTNTLKIPYDFLGMIPIVFYCLLTTFLNLSTGIITKSIFFSCSHILLFYMTFKLFTFFNSAYNTTYYLPVAMKSIKQFLKYFIKYRIIILYFSLSVLFIIPQWVLVYLNINYNLTSSHLLSLYICIRLFKSIIQDIESTYF